MKAETRRKEIITRLAGADKPVSASRLAEEFGVSRQVIVGDIAIIRASGMEISSLARGYVLEKKNGLQRVFKVRHTDEDVEKELNLIVDAGGEVVDVFVFHKFYGTLRADMNLKSRLHVQQFLENIASGKSSLLMNVTSGYHYHTVAADNVEILDVIEKKLEENGFLAPLQEYEPTGVTVNGNKASL